MKKKGRNQVQYMIKKRQYNEEGYEEYDQYRYSKLNYANNNTQKSKKNIRNSHHLKQEKIDKFSGYFLRTFIKKEAQPIGQSKIDYKKGNQHREQLDKKGNDKLAKGIKIYQPQFQQQKKRLDDQIEQYKQQRIKAQQNSKSNQKVKSQEQSVCIDENLSFSQLKETSKDINHFSLQQDLSFQFDPSFNKINSKRGRYLEQPQMNFIIHQENQKISPKARVIIDNQQQPSKQENILADISLQDSNYKQEILAINKIKDPSIVSPKQHERKPFNIVSSKKDNAVILVDEGKTKLFKQQPEKKNANEATQIKVISKYGIQKQDQIAQMQVKTKSNQDERIKIDKKVQKVVGKKQNKKSSQKQKVDERDLSAEMLIQQKIFQQLINLNDSFDRIPLSIINETQQKLLKARQLQNKPRQQDVRDSIKSSLDNPQVAINLIFQPKENVLEFMIKQVELVKLGVTIKLESTGSALVKKLQQLERSQLQKYITFSKISHYFPRMGSVSSQNLHYVQMIQDDGSINPANCIELGFCKIRANPQSIQDFQVKRSKQLIIRLVSIRCMQCETKNEVVISDGKSVFCSCRKCSAKIQGRIVGMSASRC